MRTFAINDVDTAYGVVKGFTTTSFSCGSTLTDIDGNEYATLQLGSQCWMQQNLRTTRYADGTEIPLGDATSNFDSPFRFAPGEEDISQYGYLYNWAAAMHGSSSSSANPSGVQGICPDGWHMPSDAEWTQLTDFVASDTANVCDGNPANIVKSLASTEGWGPYHVSDVTCRMSTNPSTNNRTGFSILPAGTWNTGAIGQGTIVYSNGGHTIFRSTTQHDISIGAYDREFYDENTYIGRAYIYKTTAASVRCVLDKCGSDPTYKPTVSVVKFTDTVGTTVSMEGSVSSDGGASVTERGVCWGTSSQPTINSNHTASGSGIGAFTVDVDFTFAPGTTYYVRAYATNSAGTAYGAEVTYVMPNIPTVTTTAATNVTAHTATSGGEVTADGGIAVTARGVCWSTEPEPTIGRSNTDTTVNGNGLGSFVATIKNLISDTTYYVRAYAINAVGPAYGEEDTIVTPSWSLNLTSNVADTSKMCAAPSKTVTYTATPSYGVPGDYNYTWECSNGTNLSDTSYTVSFTYISSGTYTVTCTAHHKSDPLVYIDATITKTIIDGGAPIYLAMCSEGLTVSSVEEVNNYNNRYNYVSSISWGDGGNTPINSGSFSHTYSSPGIYTVTITSNSQYGNCELSRTFAVGDDFVPYPCMVAVAHTSTSIYTSSTGGLETTNSEGKVTTVADNDGNTYKVAQIGSQCWMAENLRSTVKRDGTPIPIGTEANSSTDYRYNPVGGVSADPYGYFYNWTAVMNGDTSSRSGIRGICPFGWHVPSRNEWNKMLTSVGTNKAAKLAAGCNWKPDYNNNYPYVTPTKLSPGDYLYVERNSSGFEALPAGTNEGSYSISANFWTSEETSSASNYAYYYYITWNNSSASSSNAGKAKGNSLRCVRDDSIAEPINLSVTTDSVNNIEPYSATLYGTISNPDGATITTEGFEYRAAAGGNYTLVTATADNPMRSIVTGLEPNTEYIFRAIAKTATATVYGVEQSFTTEELRFAVSTDTAINITMTSAKLIGSFFNPDPDHITVTAQGFQWKETTGGSYQTVDTLVGNPMSYDLDNLNASTEYVFRAFATISTGGDTIFGGEKTFTTLAEAVTDLSLLTGPYVAQDGDILVGTLTSPYQISVAPGATVTLRGVTINLAKNDTTPWAGITCDNNATIVLEGSNIVKCLNQNYPGIYIAPDMTLTIEGTGSLNARSDGNSAGIGGGYNIPCGNIVINSGSITAQSGSFAAGIGSGRSSTCGNITINGGTVNASSSGSGAGIGTGAAYDANLQNTCGNITITGGTLIATGAAYGAGIGTGLCRANMPNTCGDISITGGTVTATGGSYGAGIGTGSFNYNTNNNTNANNICGDISITGGTVTATGGESATGIGNGKRYIAQSFTNVPPSICGDITIGSGVTKVTAVKGAAGTTTNIRVNGVYININEAADYCIGRSKNTNTCGTVTIGGEDKTPGVLPNSGNNTYIYPQP